MRKALFFVAAAFVLAQQAQACFECCSPPPYTRSACCESICGGSTCSAETTSSYSFCAPEGFCAQNRIYCAPHPEPGPEIPPVWTRCEPPMSQRWALKEVRIERPRSPTSPRRG